MSDGFKKDNGKLPLDLITPSFLRGTAEVLAFGAKKYSPNGWRNRAVSHPEEARWTRLHGALLRHLSDWVEGKVDPETGLSHLKHAACNLLFLIEFEEKRMGTDDRWSAPVPVVAPVPAPEIPEQSPEEEAEEGEQLWDSDSRSYLGRCNQANPSLHYNCTRKAGHTGNHVAVGHHW